MNVICEPFGFCECYCPSVGCVRYEDGYWYFLNVEDRMGHRQALLGRQDLDVVWAAFESFQRAAVEDAARSTPDFHIIWKYDKLLNAFVEVPHDSI